jgi:hypothetical protein
MEKELKMSSLSLIFLVLGFVALVVFFLVKNDKGLQEKHLTRRPT